MQAANSDFYVSLDKTCCGKLQKIDFPIFQPSTTDIRAATLLSPRGRGIASVKLTPKDNPSSKGDVISLSLALSLGKLLHCI